jgi:hypothetical protein
VRRIRRDPRASFLVEAGELWADLHAVHLTGRAEVLEGAEEERLAPTVDALIAAKYDAYRTPLELMPEETRRVYLTPQALIRFVPDRRMLNWDNRKLGLSPTRASSAGQPAIGMVGLPPPASR